MIRVVVEGGKPTVQFKWQLAGSVFQGSFRGFRAIQGSSALLSTALSQAGCRAPPHQARPDLNAGTARSVGSPPELQARGAQGTPSAIDAASHRADPRRDGPLPLCKDEETQRRQEGEEGEGPESRASTAKKPGQFGEVREDRPYCGANGTSDVMGDVPRARHWPARCHSPHPGPSPLPPGVAARNSWKRVQLWGRSWVNCLPSFCDARLDHRCITCRLYLEV